MIRQIIIHPKQQYKVISTRTEVLAHLQTSKPIKSEATQKYEVKTPPKRAKPPQAQDTYPVL